MGEDEFTALYQEMSGRIFSFAARRLPVHLADDIVAQTFETAWLKRRESPRDPDERMGWVFVIGRFKILHEVQRRVRKPHDHRFIDDHHGQPHWQPDVADTVVESAAGRWVYGQLTAIERDLFDVAFMRDVTREQAAAMLAITVTTFNTRISRLRSRIRVLERQAELTDLPLERRAQ
jgi:RNA polymerase sigma-70 factor (ECF subfamily)